MWKDNYNDVHKTTKWNTEELQLCTKWQKLEVTSSELNVCFCIQSTVSQTLLLAGTAATYAKTISDDGKMTIILNKNSTILMIIRSS